MPELTNKEKFLAGQVFKYPGSPMFGRFRYFTSEYGISFIQIAGDHEHKKFRWHLSVDVITDKYILCYTYIFAHRRAAKVPFSKMQFIESEVTA